MSTHQLNDPFFWLLVAVMCFVAAAVVRRIFTVRRADRLLDQARRYVAPIDDGSQRTSHLQQPPTP
jgi:hypothetical protein